MIRFPMAEIVRRLPRVVLGLFLFGVGIAMMVEGNLGLGPWDVFHQGVSSLTGLSIGTVILLVGAVVVLMFIPLQEKVGLGTLLNVLLIGPSVDLTLAIIPDVTQMAVRILLMVGGPIVIAIGSGFYLGGGLGPGPRDGMMTGLAKRGIKVWKARLGLELVVLLAGLALGGRAGAGTLWFALGIGPLVHFFMPKLAMDDPDPIGLEVAS